jgi:hypothetical protein
MKGRNDNQTANRYTAPDANVEPDTANAPDGSDDIARVFAPCCISFHHVRCRLADMDGISIKAVLDGIVHAGILADDSTQQVTEIRHSQSKGKNEKTTITLEWLECVTEADFRAEK